MQSTFSMAGARSSPTPHSRYPVIRDRRQNIIGVVSAKNVVALVAAGRSR